MIADPRAVAARWPDARVRALAQVAVAVSETPWDVRVTLPAEDHAHAVMLAAYFGHLNRVADAVGVPLDYPVRQEPPHAEPATPALAPAPSARAASIADALARRPATGEAMAAWRDYVLERDAPLGRDQRVRLARHVERLVGLASGEAETPSRGEAQDRERAANERAALDSGGHRERGGEPALEPALACLAELVTLAPWRLDAACYAPLRAAGFDDEALFDVVVVASTAGMLARIAVALRA